MPARERVLSRDSWIINSVALISTSSPYSYNKDTPVKMTYLYSKHPSAYKPMPCCSSHSSGWSIMISMSLDSKIWAGCERSGRCYCSISSAEMLTERFMYLTVECNPGCGRRDLHRHIARQDDQICFGIRCVQKAENTLVSTGRTDTGTSFFLANRTGFRISRRQGKSGLSNPSLPRKAVTDLPRRHKVSPTSSLTITRHFH